MEKNSELKTARSWLVALSVAAVQLPSVMAGAPNREAQVTAIINQVSVVTGSDAARAIIVNDRLPDGAVVKTGVDSRIELTFADNTLTRLGSNTVFNFKNGTRVLDLHEGAMLLQAPKGARGTRIDTGGIAAEIGGTTVIFENHPTIYKFLVLQGTARLYRPGHLGDSLLVRAGQMVFGNPKAALSEPVDFDIGRFLKTSRFIVDFAPLRSETLLAHESQKQQRAKSKKTLIDTNLVIFGGGTVVSLTNPAPTQTAGHEIAASTASTSGAIPDSTDLGTIETRASAPNPTPAATSTDRSQ